MKLTLPEELLLLMLDDESGVLHERAAPSAEYALAGAVLAELVLAGRIEAGPGILRVVDATPTGDALEDGVLARIAAAKQPMDTKHWVETLGTDAESYREALFARLVSKGILRAEEGRFLWVFHERRYPEISGREEREAKARIMAVLFGEAAPAPRDALLVGLCRAAGLFDDILAGHEVDHLQPRIDAVADTQEIGRGTAEAVREIYAEIARYAPMI
jgi:hypothetical protein